MVRPFTLYQILDFSYAYFVKLFWNKDYVKTYPWKMIFINSSDVVIYWFDYTSGYQTVNLSIVCFFTTLSMLFGFVFYFNLLWESCIIILCLNAGTAIRWFTNCSPDTELKSLCQFTICNVPFNLDHMTNYHCKPHDNCTVCHIIPNTQGHVSLRVPLCGKTPNMDWNVIIGVGKPDSWKRLDGK